MVDWAWFRELSPWLQGLFGGAGVTLLWEIVLKPTRIRRSVTKVLAEEVSLALEACAGARLQLEDQPNAIPGDFHIGTGAFEAVASELGALPSHDIGSAVLFYHQAQVMNTFPASFGETLDRWTALAVVGDNAERRYLKQGLDQHLVVYRNSLEKMVERANELLPRLRRLSVPWWRLDYLVRKKPKLSLEELRTRVNEHNAKLHNDLKERK